MGGSGLEKDETWDEECAARVLDGVCAVWLWSGVEKDEMSDEECEAWALEGVCAA